MGRFPNILFSLSEKETGRNWNLNQSLIYEYEWGIWWRNSTKISSEWGRRSKHLCFHLHENPIPYSNSLQTPSPTRSSCIKGWFDTTEFKEEKKINYFLTTINEEMFCYDKRDLEADILHICRNHLLLVTLLLTIQYIYHLRNLQR